MALRLGKIRINRLWGLVVAAIVLGLLATWLSVTYLKNREKAIEVQLQERAKGGATDTVIVPTDDLPEGTVIQDGVVAGREIAVDLVYKDTLRVTDFDAISGMRLLRPVQKGRPLMREDIIDDTPKQFAQMITKGMRAVTVDIDDLNSISQMLKPGNFIDLNLIAPESGGTSGSQEALLFLQHVKVLATGAVTQANQGVRDDRQNASADILPQYSTVTLEVTPEEAAYIILAQQSGHIRATLRAVEDTDIASYPPVTSSRLIGFGKKTTTASSSNSGYVASSDRKVEYIVGGTAGAGSAPPINITVPGLPGMGMPAQPAAGMSGIPPIAASTASSAMNQSNSAVYSPR